MIVVKEGKCYSWRGYQFKGKLADYTVGRTPPNYPVPALRTDIEYVFHNPPWLGDGVFVRVNDCAVLGAYRDGLPFD